MKITGKILSIMVLVFFLFFFKFSLLEAQTHQRVGTNSAQSLELESSVRAAGMGGAFAALADDANILGSNPAGLARINLMQIQPVQSLLFGELRYNYIGWVYPLASVQAQNIEDLGAIGGSFALLDSGEIQGRDENGNPAGKFQVRDRIISLAYGKNIADNWSIGITGKYLRQEIDIDRAIDYAFDIGTLFNTPVDNLFGAVVWQNIGKKIELTQLQEPLPFNVKAGVLYQMLDDKLNLTCDLNKPRYDYYRLNFGAELWLLNIFALRAGYQTRQDIGNGLTLGLGLSIKQLEFGFFPFAEIMLDYAYLPYGDLGQINRIGLLVKFGID